MATALEDWDLLDELDTPPTSALSFTLNGRKVTIANPDPTQRLVDYLRDVEGMNGTKVCCREGGCGACTVLLETETGERVPVNSCLRHVCSMSGQSLTTVEGIGDSEKGYNPVQTAIADGYGSQCGFCTPGMVMSIYGALQGKNKAPSYIEGCIDGNICRCTGYRPILDAAHKVASSCSEAVSSPSAVSPPASSPPTTTSGYRYTSTTGLTWTAPTTLKALSDALKSPGSMLIAGGTAAGVSKYYSGEAWQG